MGASYRRPGIDCDLGKIWAAAKDTHNGDDWHAFCDCNFLIPGRTERWYYKGAKLEFPQAFEQMYGKQDNSPEALERTKAADGLKTMTMRAMKIIPADPNDNSWRAHLKVVSEQFMIRGDDWKKCASHFCALPSGCWNPKKNTPTRKHPNYPWTADVPGLPWADSWDKMNVHPGALTPPWTEFGAAVRGIEKADAGFWYAVGQLTSIDPSDYEPLKLWQCWWMNPFKYGLLMAKASIFIPGGALLAGVVNASVVPWTLVPFASAQVQAEGKNYVEEIIKPMGYGSVKAIISAVKYVGKCGIGINIPCGIGIAVQRAAQDQIDTDELKNIPKFMHPIIYFLAETGDQLVDAVFAAIGGNFGNVFTVMMNGIGAIVDKVKDLDETARDVLNSIRLAAKIGLLIFSGIKEGRPALAIVDGVCTELLGWSPTLYAVYAKKSLREALEYVDKAMEARALLGLGIRPADAVLKAVSGGISAINDVVGKLNEIVGGGLDEMSLVLENVTLGLKDAVKAVPVKLTEGSTAPTTTLDSSLDSLGKNIDADRVAVTRGAITADYSTKPAIAPEPPPDPNAPILDSTGKPIKKPDGTFITNAEAERMSEDVRVRAATVVTMSGGLRTTSGRGGVSPGTPVVADPRFAVARGTPSATLTTGMVSTSAFQTAAALRGTKPVVTVAPATPPKTPPVSPTVSTGRPDVKVVPPATTPNTTGVVGGGKPPFILPAPPAPSGGVATLAAGAGVGFVAGGPVGALVGAVAGYALGRRSGGGSTATPAFRPTAALPRGATPAAAPATSTMRQASVGRPGLAGFYMSQYGQFAFTGGR